jgi:Protein of unknown function (DUF1566)
MKLIKPTHKPGDRIDNLIYVGVIKDYHLLCKELDEPEQMKLNQANKLFLPTREELSLMYANKDLIGGFKDGWYWSSTEYDNGNYWIQRFSDGYQNYFNKNFAFYVRCVRRVSLFDDSIIKKIAQLKEEIRNLEESI